MSKRKKQPGESFPRAKQSYDGLSRSMLARIYFIDRQIASGTYPSTKKLAEDYECGKATISRDVDFLRDMMGAPIEYDAGRRGYYYTDRAFRLPGGFSSAGDMLALGIVRGLLSPYQDTPIYNAIRNLLDSIAAPFDTHAARNKDETSRWYEGRIVTPPVPSAPVKQDLWETITSGLRENRLISFEYQGTWDEEYQPRRVRPYQLLFDNGLWYLYGYAEERRAIRMFSLARIRNAVLCPNTFTLPEDYDYRSGSRKGRSGEEPTGASYFGVFAGVKKYRFRVAFYDESIVWAAERTWAADQVVEDQDRGIILKFTSCQYDKVLEWVLSRGCTARPLKPAVLVEDWQYNVKMMAKKR
jgi:predicted DNA-binding transcriptional regulator YafY